MDDKVKDVACEVIEVSAKTALSLIPVGGELISGVWDAIKSNTAQKRLDEWKALVEERLSKIEITLEDVGNNENFTSAMFQATELAIKTAENKKREYLANAVLNALTCPMEESLVMIFLNMIEKYTLWHLKILDFFQNPKKFKGVNVKKYCMGSPIQVLYDVYPDLKQYESLVNQIVKELYSDGLMNTDSLSTMMTADGMVSSRTTKLGNQFIKFITEP